jgi:hypothetical protein
MPTERRRSPRLGLALAIALAAALLPAGAASAAVGADDYNLAAPLLFSVPGTVADNTSYGVLASEPTLCGSSTMMRTAWWKIAGTGKPITLSTAGSTFDTVLAVYDGPAPLTGNRVTCNDDDGSGGVTSALTFNSVRGRSYLVQVGANAFTSGRIDLSASSSARPANDDRIAARALSTGVAATVSNAGAGQELGERLTCGIANYAATMWFSWTAPSLGDAVFTSSGAFGDTVVTVYRGGSVVGCNAGSTARVPVRTTAGEYLIQVGSKGSDVDGLGVGPLAVKAAFTPDNDADHDGDPASTDCNDHNPAIRHGIVDIPDDGIDQNCDGADATNPDRDGDGETRPADCNDNDPAIHHGAVDIPGDGIDQDCSGADAPFPLLGSSIHGGWAFDPFRFTKLRVSGAVAGTTVSLRCHGGGCPFSRATVKVRKTRASQSVLVKKLAKARLKRGAKLDIRVTKPGFVGLMRRYTVRKDGTDPRSKDSCLSATTGKTQSCSA